MKMKIVIFGASGKVGQLVTAELLKRGHNVTACIYGSNPFAENEKLKIMSGDVHSLSDVEKAVNGNDVVVSTLGSWGTQTKDILSSAMTHIVPTMEKHKISRLVSLTGADARDKGDTPNLLQKCTHLLFGTLQPKIMADGEAHLQILRSSKLDWTVVRSPVMTSSGSYGDYRLRNRLPLPWAKINRLDVALAIADLAENHEFIHQSPVIYTS